ncbi:MAG: VWA domain-containing protein [Gammaproteobacteria bacterium]|nr:VWA domain-containing protein [Gammaproteobacteria bacterium]
MTFFGLQWALPTVLLLLPLALLPWFTHNQDKTVAWSHFVPADPISNVIGLSLKILASLVVASLIFTLAGPHVPEKKVERVGKGAEVVILVDRSRSMDDPFSTRGKALAVNRTVGKGDSKRRIAKKYLLEFVDKRPDNRFGFVLFSDKALDLLPLTYNKKSVVATINASALGKGLSETNIAKAMIKAAEMYSKEDYHGSRTVLLVSDGGQEFSEEDKQKITELYKVENLRLYWIYMRSTTGLSIEEESEDDSWKNTPEKKLHKFFKELAIPYRVFEIESVKSFSEAIDTIDEQQDQTLIVEEIVPRENKTEPFFWLALITMLALVFAQFYTAWGVRKAHD